MGTIIRGEVKKANSVREEAFFEYEASRVAEKRILEEEFSVNGFFCLYSFCNWKLLQNQLSPAEGEGGNRRIQSLKFQK